MRQSDSDGLVEAAKDGDVKQVGVANGNAADNDGPTNVAGKSEEKPLYTSSENSVLSPVAPETSVVPVNGAAKALGLVLCGVAILLLSNVVGATAIGAFIGELVGLSIVNASVLGCVIIGAIGLSGVGLVSYSWYSSPNAVIALPADAVEDSSDLFRERTEGSRPVMAVPGPQPRVKAASTNPPSIEITLIAAATVTV